MDAVGGSFSEGREVRPANRIGKTCVTGELIVKRITTVLVAKDPENGKIEEGCSPRINPRAALSLQAFRAGVPNYWLELE